MERNINILTEIFAELQRAKQKHPIFPDDPIHAAAILGEESGELTQAALDFVYHNGTIERMKEEAVQCGAMAIRFLENLARYEKFKEAKDIETTAVTWITFDGTKNTLPENHKDVIIGNEIFWLLFRDGRLIWESEMRPSRGIEVGDRWAYLPEQPVRNSERV